MASQKQFTCTNSRNCREGVAAVVALTCEPPPYHRTTTKHANPSRIPCPVSCSNVLFRFRSGLTGCFSSIVCGNHLFADLTDVQFSLTCPLFLHPPFPSTFWARGQKSLALGVSVCSLILPQKKVSFLPSPPALIENVRRTLK